MTRFEAYTLRRLVVPLIAIFYVTAALCLKPAINVETFPFFNWSLFSHTATKRSDVVVMLRMVDGIPIDPPRLYYEMKEMFASAKSRDIRFSKASWRLAVAIRTGNQSKVHAIRRVIEQTFMREAREAHYDLAIITYDPIERYRSGTIESMKVVTSFEKRVP